MNRLLRGAIAGATGTIALDLTTYSDMLVRGRGASSVPAQVAGVLAEQLGIMPLAACTAGEKADHRREAAGALLGYTTGVGMGALYGLLRGQPHGSATPLAGVAVGLSAMAASDLPIALTGVSDPATWSAADWLADIIPHLVYGLVTVAVYEAIGEGS
ncbi:MAG: hypothetical protein M3Z20_19400 [Chloroflexota bacterium]|nr:hypothetical protein [Chloroflexota bacterium]